jgi:hypothetical protein
MLLVVSLISAAYLGSAGAQSPGQPAEDESSDSTEAVSAFVLCGTRYFAARGRVEPSRGFAEIEAGLRNACLRELVAYRQVALPEDASRNDVNKAVRALQTQHRRQFRAAYDTAAVAEVKRRRTQEVVAAPTPDEQTDAQASDGSATEAQAPPTAIAPAASTVQRVPLIRPIPLPLPRPRDLAGPVPTPADPSRAVPVPPIMEATPAAAEPVTTANLSSQAQPAPPPAQPVVEPQAVPEMGPTATTVQQAGPTSTNVPASEPVAAAALATPDSPGVLASQPPVQQEPRVQPEPPAPPASPTAIAPPAVASSIPGPEPSGQTEAGAETPTGSTVTTMASAASALAPTQPARTLPPSIAAAPPEPPRPQVGGPRLAAPAMSSLTTSPANTGEAITQVARQFPSSERVRLLDSAIGQHRVCLARAVLSVSGSKTTEDLLVSAMKACSEQQEARIAREFDVAGPVATETAQRMRSTVAAATRTEAMELITLLRGTKP